MATYTFTHVSNANFTTRVTLTNAGVGLVNWQVSFIRANTNWTSFNLNVPPNSNAPRFDFALGGVGFGANYTYDFRNAGLERNIGSGQISVTPGASLALTGANDPKGSMGTASASGSFTTEAWPTPSWNTGSNLPTATRGSSYFTSVSASPATSYGLVSSSGASGLSVDSGGNISGTPTTQGTATLVIRAFNNSSSADRTFFITVNPPAPVFTDASVSPTARINAFYSDQVEASNATSYSVNSGSLPTGISLDNNTGQISGTPNTAGTYNFSIRAFNVTGSVATGTLTITVFSSAGVWNGSTFVSGRVRVWNGTQFVDDKSVKVWNGSAWVNAK